MNFFSRLASCCAATLFLVACGAVEPVPAGESRTVYPPQNDCAVRPFVGEFVSSLNRDVMLGGTLFQGQFGSNPSCPNNNEVMGFKLGICGKISLLYLVVQITNVAKADNVAQTTLLPLIELTNRIDQTEAACQTVDVPLSGCLVPPGAQVLVMAMGSNLTANKQTFSLEIASLWYRSIIGVEGGADKQTYVGEDGVEPFMPGGYVNIHPLTIK